MAKRAIRRDISVDLLRSFVAVVDSRSFKGAASTLELSQPTVSGHIARLQRHLGVALFDKSRPGVWLTPAGEAAAESARQIVALHDELPARIASKIRPSDAAAEIRIGCPDELRCWLLVPTLAEFQKQHPDVHFVLRRGTSQQLLTQLDEGTLELSAAIVREPAANALRSWKQALVWIGPAELRRGEVPVPIVAPPDGAVQEAMFSELARQTIPYVVTFQAAHMDGAIAAVREGLGYSVIASGDIPEGLAAITDDPRFPPLAPLYWGIYVGEAGSDPIVQEVTVPLVKFLESSIGLGRGDLTDA